jgi:asparagine synthase (glutamine-hydrolysing)
MCGIAGILAPSGDSLPARVDAMLHVQRHRGPDDSGTWVRDSVGLGQVRLSILDLSEAGHQPMVIDDRFVIVFNGEVFNFVELRRELEGRGYDFRSGTDTEVVLCAYQEWGTECCSHFNGMWGLAIYDTHERTLFCSRDRLGVKPFHYAFVHGEFLFASEIKGILAARPDLAEPEHAYIARFLRTSLVNDDERTFFRHICSLPPAHWMMCRMEGGRVSVSAPVAFWAYDPERARATYDFADAAGTLRDLLDDSVRLRLRADVPVGTCLSGGLDSSSIVAFASRRLNHPVRTFSSVYREPGYDELRYIDTVNDAFGTLPFKVEAKPDDLLELMPRIAWHQDEPTAGPGVYSQWHVMEMVQGRVKVLLDGQGADELLAGYEYFFADAVRSLAREALRHPSADNLGRWVRSIGFAHGRLGGALPRQLLMGYLSEPTKQVLRRFRPRGARSEVRQEYLGLMGDEDPWTVAGPFRDRLSNALHDATFKKSLPALLRYEDRDSMAFSIEARTPFLDYRIVEFALTLPVQDRIDGDWTKAALRRAMAGILPDEITWRKDKLGYPTPLAVWLRGPFKAQVDEFINSPEFRSRDVFDVQVVDAMWSQHLSGQRDHSWNIWRWLSLEYWFRVFIDGSVRPGG